MSPAGQPPANVSPPYNPTPYLVSRSGLSRDEFLAQYDEFRNCVRHVEAAPELVFERLVGNLTEAFIAAMALERTQYAAAQEAWLGEKTTLQVELTHATTANKRAAAKRTVIVRLPPSIPPPAIAPAASFKQIYLQFWFDYSHHLRLPSTARKSTGVHAATTSTPVPYSLSSSWPDTEIMRTCNTHGSYDSRMEPLITGATIPTTITNHVAFRSPFAIPPKVVVWLTGLSATAGASVSVKVTANDITEDGFVLQISSGNGAGLGSVGAAWAVWAEKCERQTSPVTLGSLKTLTPGNSGILNGKMLVRQPGTLENGTAIVMVAVSAVELVVVGTLSVDVMAFPGGCPGGGGSSWILGVEPAVARVFSIGAVHVSQGL